MSQQNAMGRFAAELLELLEETFERSHGIYLYPGTALFETLAEVSAEEASRPVCTEATTLAAQIAHVSFYLQVLEALLLGTASDTVDWEEIWTRIHVVTPEAWDTIRQELKQTYRQVCATLQRQGAWEGENEIGEALAILTHSAYHLGVLRQALCTLRQGNPPSA